MDFADRLYFAPARAARLARRHGAQHLASRTTSAPQVADTRTADIRETVSQPWPRVCGDRIDAAEVWVFAGFEDAQVVAWLEAGVPTAAAATRLSLAGLEPREVSRQYECDDPSAAGRAGVVTLGLAFARGDVDIECVRRLRRR